MSEDELKGLALESAMIGVAFGALVWGISYSLWWGLFGGLVAFVVIFVLG